MLTVFTSFGLRTFFDCNIGTNSDVRIRDAKSFTDLVRRSRCCAVNNRWSAFIFSQLYTRFWLDVQNVTYTISALFKCNTLSRRIKKAYTNMQSEGRFLVGPLWQPLPKTPCYPYLPPLPSVLTRQPVLTLPRSMHSKKGIKLNCFQMHKNFSKPYKGLRLFLSPVEFMRVKLCCFSNLKISFFNLVLGLCL
jgi:hypothetical protein